MLIVQCVLIWEAGWRRAPCVANVIVPASRLRYLKDREWDRRRRERQCLKEKESRERRAWEREVWVCFWNWCAVHFIVCTKCRTPVVFLLIGYPSVHLSLPLCLFPPTHFFFCCQFFHWTSSQGSLQGNCGWRKMPRLIPLCFISLCCEHDWSQQCSGYSFSQDCFSQFNLLPCLAWL